MRRRIFSILLTFVTLTALMWLQKPLFAVAVGGYHASEVWQSMVHGLSMDAAMAGYLCVVPAMLVIASVWTCRAVTAIARAYFAVVSACIAMACVANAALYPYWGFPLDTTPIFYFTTSPTAAMASIEWWQWVLGAAAIIILAMAYYESLNWAFAWPLGRKCKPMKRKWPATCVLCGVTACLFIPMRGGITVSTMNLSRAYFSHDNRLNHAAVNPLFSLMYASMHQADLAAVCQYLPMDQAQSLFASLAPDSVAEHPLCVEPEHIHIIILESFSSHLLPSLGGDSIAMRLDSIAAGGWLFTDIYSSSFRTDRALPAILNGYPAQPTTSIMKYVSKLDALPSVAKSLKDKGYATAYYYGGDVNFTNMNALLVAGGYDKIVRDTDFPLGERLSKWGAHDEHVFARALADARAAQGKTLTVVQTSSSHEPFEVPYQGGSGNKRVNAFEYADSCLGAYVDQLRTLPSYANTLIVIVPDHYGVYPEGLTDHVQRHRVPLVMAGGAIDSCAVDSALLRRIGSQTDIAATVLDMAGVDRSHFGFSHSLLGPGRKPYAFFSEPGWIGIVTEKGYSEVNLDAGTAEGPDSLQLKAYGQVLYHDISGR